MRKVFSKNSKSKKKEVGDTNESVFPENFLHGKLSADCKTKKKKEA